MRRTRKPVGGVPRKRKRGRQSAREREREREVKHYQGKESRAGKKVLKTQQMTSSGGQHNTAGTYSRSSPAAHYTGKNSEGEESKKVLLIPVSSSKGSTWLCLEMTVGAVDNKVGWRFAAVPHCKAAVAQSRL